MIAPEAMEWILFALWAALALYLGMSKLRLLVACPIALGAMLIPMAYNAHSHGWPEMGGIFHLLIGGSIPFVVRRVRQRGSLLPKDPRAG
jgi:hypothetical protein